MRRREFIAGLGGAATAAALPSVVRAQPSLPVIGFLGNQSPGPFAPIVAAFLQGLKDTGHVEGKNVAIEFRWSGGQYDRLPPMAAELVGRRVAVIATAGGNVAAFAAKAATSTIPIVFATADDPVATGIVSSLSRPGGNLTGVSWVSGALQAKYLEMMSEVVPSASVFGVLVNPDSPSTEIKVRDAQAAAATMGKTIHVVKATTERDIDAAFDTLVHEHVGALIVGSDPFFNLRRAQLVDLAARNAIPTIYFLRDFALAGGLMSYGSSLAEAFRQSGIYTGRILKGEKAADLPVQQSTKVELVINLKTAKTLGLTFPLPLLGRADEVIE